MESVLACAHPDLACYQKIREGDIAHPCKSPNGLLSLSQLFRARPVIFVRTIRHPREIVNSFYGARKYYADTQSSAKRLGQNSDERILDFITRERECTIHQVSIDHHESRPRPVVLVVQYERLSCPAFRRGFATKFKQMCGLWSDEMDAALMRFGDPGQSVRDGRLMPGKQSENLIAPGSTMDTALLGLPKYPDAWKAYQHEVAYGAIS